MQVDPRLVAAQDGAVTGADQDLVVRIADLDHAFCDADHHRLDFFAIRADGSLAGSLLINKGVVGDRFDPEPGADHEDFTQRSSD